MPKLTITSGQKTFLDNIDGDLEKAFAEGVQVSPTTAYLDPTPRYATLPAAHKTAVKNSFRQVVAALLVRYAGLTTTVNYTKAGGGSGTLTFTNGILTGST